MYTVVVSNDNNYGNSYIVTKDDILDLANRLGTGTLGEIVNLYNNGELIASAKYQHDDNGDLGYIQLHVDVNVDVYRQVDNLKSVHCNLPLHIFNRIEIARKKFNMTRQDYVKMILCYHHNEED